MIDEMASRVTSRVVGSGAGSVTVVSVTDGTNPFRFLARTKHACVAHTITINQ